MSMKRDNGQVFSVILIWIFAGCIIALGLKELYRKHRVRDASVTSAEVQALKDELQGDVIISRASINPEKKIEEETAPKRAPLTYKEVFKRLLPDTVK